MVKIKDIALAANVSVSTASKALRNSNDLSELTIARVQETAVSMGYKMKDGLREKKKGNVIGVVAPELCSSYYMMILDSLRKTLAKQKMRMILMLTDFSKEEEVNCIRHLLRSEVVGIVCFSEHHEMPEELIKLIQSNVGVSFFLISMVERNPYCDSLCMDETQDLLLAVNHLKELGHTRIAYVGEPLTVGKKDAFISVMHENGLEIPDDYVVVTQSRFEKSGEEGANALLSLEEPPTAIFCAYDEIARGVITTATRRGYKVPEDLSVVGACDIYSAQYMNPPLTTVADFVEDAGEVVCALLKTRINRKDKPIENIHLNSRLIVRDSTAAPRA